MRYKYRGCEILIREFSGMYQAMIRYSRRHQRHHEVRYDAVGGDEPSGDDD
jgi:hypothetical protein